MAIIRPGPLAGAISGRLGGVVFVAGKGTPFVRPRPAPISNTSARLATRKSHFGRIVNAWSQLTDDERLQWRTAAALLKTTNRLGLSKPMPAFAYYVKTNMTGNMLGGTTSVTPPNPFIPDPPTALTLTFSVAGAYTVAATKPVAAIFISWTIFGWAFMRDSTPGDIPRPVFIDDTFSSADLSHDVKIPWTTRFGAIQAGQHFTVDIIARVSSNPFLQRIRASGIAVA